MKILMTIPKTPSLGLMSIGASHGALASMAKTGSKKQSVELSDMSNDNSNSRSARKKQKPLVHVSFKADSD